MTEQALATRHDEAPAVHSGGALTPMEMIGRAIETGMGPETMEKLLALQERWEANQGRKAFDNAVADAKAKIPPIVKNRQGHNNKKYADFAAIAKVVDPIITAHGLSYRFRTNQEADRIHVTCILSHRGGHSEETTLAGPPDASGSKNAIQAIGSTLSYLQRYSLMQCLGLAATEDDDGRTAMGAGPISRDQIETLRALMTEAKADGAKFCDHFRIDALDSLPASQFETAKRILETKARAAKEAGQ